MIPLDLSPVLIALAVVVASAAAYGVLVAHRERTVHAPDRPGMTLALLIRQHDTIRTAEGDLLVDDASFTGDGKVAVVAAPAGDPFRTYRFEYPVTQRVHVVARVASPLVGKVSDRG